MSDPSNSADQCELNGSSGMVRDGQDLVAEVDDVEAIAGKEELAEVTTPRRVTFSDDNMIHHIPGHPPSNGDDSSWYDEEEAAAAAGATVISAVQQQTGLHQP